MNVSLFNLFFLSVALSFTLQASIQMPLTEQLQNELRYAGFIRVVERSSFIQRCAGKLLKDDELFEAIVTALTTAYEVGNGICFERSKDAFILSRGEELLAALENHFIESKDSLVSEYFWYVQDLIRLHSSCR